MASNQPVRSTRIPRRVIGRMIDSRWAMRRDALDMMISIVNRQDLTALADQVPQYRETPDGEILQVRGRVGIINVAGPCFRYANFFTWFCGATSYDDIARQLDAFDGDDGIDAVIVNTDTPGGEVTGCAEAAAKIANFSKPIIAYVDGDCCSAGYWLASACDHIAVSTTAQVGCLGVVGLYTDTTVRDEMEGLTKYEIVSSLTPNKRPDPATDDGRAQLLRAIDATADVFLGDVGVYRGITGGPAAVAKAFGAGDIFIGQDAVDIGLADEVSDFESVLASLSPAA